tara:strand:- start:6993 stop:7292 length:300 start_codon:yes stop_codon:yes gene_type:complete
MILKLDENKVPIKYILGIHESLPDYPTGMDILYEKIRRHVGEEKKWNFTKHSVMRYMLKNADEDRVDDVLKELIEDGYIRTINETKGKESFKILKNPFE